MSEILSSSRYSKGPPPYSPYLGFEHCDCHLLQNKRPHSELKLEKVMSDSCIQSTTALPCHVHGSLLQPLSYQDTDGVNEEEQEKAVIVSSSEVWEDLYHFVTPLRACNLPPSRLKPLVLLLEKE